MAEWSDDELLAELGVEVTALKKHQHTAEEERIIAGFEEILRFMKEHQRVPQHGDERDIFESLYAVRLDRLRSLPQARELLAQMDVDGVLTQAPGFDIQQADTLDDETLLAELGQDLSGEDDITVLRHVSTRSDRQILDIANRSRCDDFDIFEPFFKTVENDLKTGRRVTQRFGYSDDPTKTSVEVGDFFILGGQLVYVAAIGEAFKAPNGESDARLRAVYSNATESNILRRSLQRALYKDEAGRRVIVVPGSDGPLFDQKPDAALFSQEWEEGEIESGTIYVLRSLSDHPYISANRDLIHKIGVTGGKVETRITNAINEATYLLADVEVVATYKLANIDRIKLESIFHRVFATAQIDLTIEDRFGKAVQPKEWFLVPLHVIDEAVKRIQDTSITQMIYDPQCAALVAR